MIIFLPLAIFVMVCIYFVCTSDDTRYTQVQVIGNNSTSVQCGGDLNIPTSTTESLID